MEGEGDEQWGRRGLSSVLGRGLSSRVGGG